MDKEQNSFSSRQTDRQTGGAVLRPHEERVQQLAHGAEVHVQHLDGWMVRWMDGWHNTCIVRHSCYWLSIERGQSASQLAILIP